MAEGKIHLNGEVWTWRMPSSSYVLIRDPQRKKTVVNPHFVREAWEKEAKAKKLQRPEHCTGPEWYPNVTPAMVKAYIQKNLVPR